MTRDEDAYCAGAAQAAADTGRELAARLADEPDPATLDAAVHWLERAVKLVDADHPQVAPESSWFNRRLLAELLRTRFSSTGSRADIERAIAHVRTVLAAMPADAPEHAEVRCELVDLCYFRAAAMTDDGDIDDLITAGLESLAAISSDSAEHTMVAALTGVVIATAMRRPTRQDRARSDLGTSIDLLREAYGRLPADSPWRASVVREYGSALVGRAEADEDTADLREGIRLLTESLGLLADHAQALAETRTALGVAIVRAAYRGLPEADLELAIRLLIPGPPEDTEDQARRGARLDTAGLAFVLRGRRQGSPGDLDRGIDHYVRALRTHPSSAPGRARTTFNLAMALQERYGQRGDLSDLDAACGHLDRLIADLDPRSPEWREAQLARSECVMSRPPGRQDRAEFDAGIALSRQQTEEMPAGHPLRPQYLNNLITALLLRFGQYQDAADAARAAELAVSMVETLPDDHAERAVLLTSAAVAVWAGGQPAGLSDQRSRILGYLREAVQASRPADPQRGRRLAALGVALLTPPGHRASDPLPMPPPGITTGERDQAIDYLNQAADLLAETPGSQLAASVLIVLARLRRARGDRSRDDHGRARQAGLAALAEHGLGVFLQSDIPNALARARAAAADAAEVALWCLADDAVTEAVVALESGRGLVLHAATTAVSVADSLRDAGEHALAREWSGVAMNAAAEPDFTLAGLLQPDYVPPALRQRVLAALARPGRRDGPLAMPTLAEITTALAEGGHDALVYLLPATSGTPGVAVIIRPSGEATALPRPELVVTPGSPVGRYASAHAGFRTRNQGSVTHQLRMTRSWDAALREIISWVGPAVIGDLLAAIGPRMDGGPPRLVLVPFGVLGMIPWHAALIPDSTAAAPGPVLRRAVFSYAASARQLGDAIARPRRPWWQAPAFVVNPLLDLPWASAEARSIRSAHGPDASFLGYLADGQERDVTAADVLALLPGRDTAGASLLHISCHGRTGGTPLDSALLLSSGQELTVGQILRQARARPADSPGGLVVLAACLSDLTDGDHDEALTVATTFLSAGAASVIGTQWEVSDARSAVLMFMTYEFLRADGGRPADALRAAQLWMLDPARATPSTMPSELAAEASRQVLDDPAAWAGYVHHGW